MAPLSVPETGTKEQLLDRRHRLRHAIGMAGQRPDLHGLLREVDSALERLEEGDFGQCEACDGTVEPERLANDPLLRRCIACLLDDEREAVVHDLERAAEIQAALLPPRELAVSGWEMHYHYDPAGAVSGDYCDVVLPRGGDEVFFFLGDVSGKGLSASILMSNLQAIFRGLLKSGAPLLDLVGTANRMFCETTQASHYATVVCGRADARGEVDLVNAGHGGAFLLAGDSVHPLQNSGMPLGLFASGSFRSHRLRLAPGDALLLATDGLLEATNAAGEEYGYERMARRLTTRNGARARELTEICVRDLERFRAAPRSDDDVTILTVRRAE
jgi:sigma-B regulation protein RsbU (phosphoserine phosphatase)